MFVLPTAELHRNVRHCPTDLGVAPMIIRAPRPPSRYLRVANDLARDTRLSYRARGLLVAILSRPDNWHTTAEQLAAEGKEGRDAIRSALSELEQVGYLRRSKMQNELGHWITVTVVSEQTEEPTATADSQPPETDSQASVNQSSVSQALIEVPRRSTKERRARETSLPEDWQPKAKEQERALAMDLDIDVEVERFRNHAEQNDRRCVSWDAAFRNWLIGSKNFTTPRGKSANDTATWGWE
jgi:hypothetical protein